MKRSAALGLAVALLVLAAPAGASAARLYVNFGDSVGAGYGASPGHSYFDLYCAYLQASAIVDQCVNEAQAGETTSGALTDGMLAKVLTDIRDSGDTPVITVSLGGNDLLRGSACTPVTGPGCPVIHNRRAILDSLETTLGTHPGRHVIKWLQYYNANHDNPFGSASQDQSFAAFLLGADGTYTDCASEQLNLIGLDDAIACIAREKGAVGVDAFAPFSADCTAGDCFSDALHPDDKGYGLLFAAFRDAPSTPVPTSPAPDGTWPQAPVTIPTLSNVFSLLDAHNLLGTYYSFVLDQPATVRLSIVLRAPGRRARGVCRAPTRRLRRRPRCVRMIPVATIVRAEPAGLGELTFSRRTRGHRLLAGHYVATLVAVDRAGRSAPHQVSFTVR